MQDEADDDWRIPPLSRNAVYVYGILDRRGRCMRVRPLMQQARLDGHAFADAVNELQTRCWVTITWRKRPEHTDHDESRPPCDAEHITATKYGRMRYPQTSM
jgi:hypothetical protein